MAGRRRFKRVGISLAKGLAKTELAAWIAACELHPEAPVRCVGWDKKGNPIGGPVTDPYIPMVAYTEEQSDELCYGTLKCHPGRGAARQRLRYRDGADHAEEGRWEMRIAFVFAQCA